MRTQATLISSALLLFALASCGGASSSVSSSGSSSASISSSVTQYALTLTGHTELLLERLDPSYPAGVIVEFATSIIYDADLNIYLDGEKIARNVADAPNWHYSFTMPSHDATLDFRIESVEYVPLVSLYPWLNVLSESDVETIRHKVGNETVTFGEVAISYSSDQDDIASALDISEMMMVALEQDRIPPGGGYVEYTFYTDSGNYSISFYAGKFLYSNGRLYGAIGSLPALKNPFRQTFKLVTHAFDCPYCRVSSDGSRSETKIAEGFSFDEVEFCDEEVEAVPEDVEAPYFAMEVEPIGEVFIYAKDFVSLCRNPSEKVRRYYQVEGDYDFSFLFQK